MRLPDHPLDGSAQAAVLKALRAGHRRYAAGTSPSAARPPAAPADPVAAVFACADPQPPAEHLFGGVELFVVRTAGLSIGPAVLGSLEYAVDELHLPLVVVLGHDSCRLPAGGGDARVRRATATLLRESTLLDRAVTTGRCAVVGMCWRDGHGTIRPVLRTNPARGLRRSTRQRPPGRRPVPR